MKRNAYHRALFCFFALILLAGCAHEDGIVLSEKDMPPAQALYERLTADPAPGKTLTGILHVTATVPGGRYTFKIATAARKPDCLRMEDLSVIGLPDFMLTASGTEVRLFLPRTGEFLVGNEASEHVLRIFPPAVKPSDLVALLYGQPPALPHGVKSLKGSVDRNRYRLDVYAGGNWAQSLWVEPGTGRMDRIEVADGSGRTAWSARMQDFTQTGSPAVPGRIDIETEGMSRIRLSLDRGDLWDERPSAEPGWWKKRTWEAGGDWDGPYNGVTPTKLPAGRVEITLDPSQSVKSFELNLATAEGFAHLSTGGKLDAFYSAVAPVILMRIPGPEPKALDLVPSGAKKHTGDAGPSSGGAVRNMSHSPPVSTVSARHTECTARPSFR